jgi:hypothetical protein
MSVYEKQRCKNGYWQNKILRKMTRTPLPPGKRKSREKRLKEKGLKFVKRIVQFKQKNYARKLQIFLFPEQKFKSNTERFYLTE